MGDILVKGTYFLYKEYNNYYIYINFYYIYGTY